MPVSPSRGSSSPSARHLSSPLKQPHASSPLRAAHRVRPSPVGAAPPSSPLAAGRSAAASPSRASRAPRAHAFSPTGLSVALVLGSQMLEDAPPDADLELSAPLSSSRLSRLASRASSAADVGLGASQRVGRIGARDLGARDLSELRPGPLTYGDEDEAGGTERTARLTVGRRTPGTLTPVAGSPIRSHPPYLSLEEFAKSEQGGKR